MIIGFLFRIVANALAVLVAARFVPGVIYSYEPISLLKIALILALVNALIKPILKLLFSPLILLTLGLFTIVINVFMVWLAAYFAPELSIIGITAYFWIMIIVNLFNFAASALTRNE
ncbi:MAG: phage holin family protein [Candidatus Azambacteria bacterium]|nr:phage holin family protein [Candidatus Azambacteria bacterium]